MRKYLLAILIACAYGLCAQDNKVTVLEYNPAPGQFINTLPSSKDAASSKEMAKMAQQSLDKKMMVCLGGFGGNIITKFDYPVKNVKGEYDIIVLGNSFNTSAEPGVIMVSKDVNKNGIADDKWYEIAGSEYERSIKNYKITYHKPTAENDAAKGNVKEYIKWEDNRGNSGWLPKNSFHEQSYYPSWISSDTISFTGTLVPDNAVDKNGDGSYYELPPYAWGYADNYDNKNTDGCSINLDWAVNEYGKPVYLSSVDFIKIHTGVHGVHGNIGESSTEITGINGLHEKFAEPEIPMASDTANMNAVVLDVNDVISHSSIEFNEFDVWAETKNDSIAFRTFGDDWFTFSHLNSGNDYDGMSWEGFTVSQSSDTSTEHENFAPNHQWGCMAGHGVDGINEPFIMGYYSFFYEKQAPEDMHSCSITFREGGDLVIPAGVYVCNTPYTTKGIRDGYFVARAFKQGDYCTLTAHGLNAEGKDNGKNSVYYLADYRAADSTKWTINDNWEWMDLSGLGAVSGIYFTMESTDCDPTWGPNTPLYFALDNMKIFTSETTTSVEENIAPQLCIYPNPCNGTLYIENAPVEIVTIYNLQGQIVIHENIGLGSIDVSGLDRGIYIVRCGDMTSKLIIK